MAELCRREGFSSATFYKWRTKFRGMEASDAKRLWELEAENARLKKLLAEAALDNEALQVAFDVSAEPTGEATRGGQDAGSDLKQ